MSEKGRSPDFLSKSKQNCQKSSKIVLLYLLFLPISVADFFVKNRQKSKIVKNPKASNRDPIIYIILYYLCY